MLKHKYFRRAQVIGSLAIITYLAMIVSHKKLLDFVDFDWSSSDFDRTMTSLGIEVEHIHSPSDKLKNFVVGKVVSKEKHANADKLSVCVVNTGNQVQTIVCGAPNVATGQTVAVALEGAIVPAGNFTIERRKIRGVESNGMICSKSELGMDEDHSGIWVLPDHLVAGVPLATAMEMDDILYTIGITPNRADCLSHLGIAREISAVTGAKIHLPESSPKESSVECADMITIEINAKEDCPRYCARVVTNVTIGESPDWLKTQLTALGIRPRNVAVDIANLVMFECGQPLHTFDYDEVHGKKIIVRSARYNEAFTTLDGKSRLLNDSMLMICDTVMPIAIAGVMGGENSEIKSTTTSILIESAYFRPSSIRKTAKALGIASEAAYRFERGVDPELNIEFAVDRCAYLLQELAGGLVSKGRVDVRFSEVPAPPITLRFERTNRILGTNVEHEKQLECLTRIGCKVSSSDAVSVTVIAPSYRVDLSLEIDLIEEIARLVGYSAINSFTSSRVSFAELIPQEFAEFNERKVLRTHLMERGFTEVLTQNQTDQNSALTFHQHPIRLANALGEDLSYMRTSLIPSLLRICSFNHRNSQKDLSLFEIGKVFYHNTDKGTKTDSVHENESLCFLLTGENAPMHWSRPSGSVNFYDAKAVIENVLSRIGLEVSFPSNKISSEVFSVNVASVEVGGNVVGTLGEVSSAQLKLYDIDQPVFVCEINVDGLRSIATPSKKFKKVSLFPAVQRDVAFVIDDNVIAGAIKSSVRSTCSHLLRDIRVFDFFVGKSIGEGKKSLAFALTFQANDRTLIDEEIEKEMTAVIQTVEENFAAKLRSN